MAGMTVVAMSLCGDQRYRPTVRFASPIGQTRRRDLGDVDDATSRRRCRSRTIDGRAVGARLVSLLRPVFLVDYTDMRGVIANEADGAGVSASIG